MTTPYAAPQRRTNRCAVASGTRVLSVVVIAAMLGACGEFNLRKELGQTGSGPDPFTVVRNKDLEIPKDRKSLPTPQPGAASRVAPTPEADARAALIGGKPTASGTPSAAEAALVKGAGASGASDDVRKKLEEESQDEDGRLLDGLIGSAADSDTLDPTAEAKRIACEKAKAKGTTSEACADLNN